LKKKEQEKEKQKLRVKPQKGDYQVLVHFIECKSVIGQGLGGQCEPVGKVLCQVGVTERKVHTKPAPDSTSEHLFDEVFVFEFSDVTPEELEAGRVYLSLYDSKVDPSQLRDVHIGTFCLDLVQIYYRKDHEMFRQWIALVDQVNPKKNPGIRGYVLASVTVLGPGDNAKQHDANDRGNENVLLPPTVDPKGRLLNILVGHVEALPVMDATLLDIKCNPYVHAEFAGNKCINKCKDGQNVFFNESLGVPVYEPVMADKITVTVYDHDVIGAGDRIGTVFLSYSDIEAKSNIEEKGEDQSGPKGLKKRWYQLYGAPEGEQRGEVARKMNRGLVPGSFYRGRIQLAAYLVDTENPFPLVVSCDGAFKNVIRTEKYVVRCDLYSATALPKVGKLLGDKKLSVQVCFGEHVVGSSKKEKKDSQCSWMEELDPIYADFPVDVTQVPDVFVYLCSGNGSRLSFARFKMSDLRNGEDGFRTTPRWVVLTNDSSTTFISNGSEPGTILLTLHAGLLKEAPVKTLAITRPLLYGGLEVKDPASTSRLNTIPESIPESTPKAVRRTHGVLQLSAMKAVNVRKMDSFGKSDPYMLVKVGEQKQQTSVIDNTLNPVWSEIFVFENVPGAGTEIRFTMMEKNNLSTEQTYPEFALNLNTLMQEAKASPGSNWVFTKDVSLNHASVKTVCTFSFTARFDYLSDEDIKAQAKLNEQARNALEEQKKKPRRESIMVTSTAPVVSKLGMFTFKEYILRINLYQMRNLMAKDSNGLSDPFMTVNLNGFHTRFPVQRATVNPAFFSFKDLKVSLPQPLGLSPPIQCCVYDWDAIDDDDVLGIFSVPATAAIQTGVMDPKWYDLTDSHGVKLERGEVLATFQLWPQDAKTSIPPAPQLRPRCVDSTLAITTLGVRSLQAKFPVSKPRVVFSLPGGKKFFTDASRLPSPSNPNYRQLIRVPVSIPTQKIFSPMLHIQVQDVLFGGMVKFMVGGNYIDMCQFFEEDIFSSRGFRKLAPNIMLEPQSADQAEKREHDRQQTLEAVKRAVVQGETDRKEAAAAAASRLSQISELQAAMKEAKAKARQQRQEEQEAKLKQAVSQEPDSKSKPADDDTGVEFKRLNEKMPEEKMGRNVVGAKEDQKAQESVGLLGEAERSDDKKAKEDDEFTCVDLFTNPKEKQRDYKPPYMIGRASVPSELENHLALSPFMQLRLVSGTSNNVENVGIWKGRIELDDFDEGKGGVEPSTPPLALSEGANKTTQTQLMLDLLHQHSLFVRVYVLKAEGLSARDFDLKGNPLASDPYLKVTIAGKTQSTRARYKSKTLNPEFYEAFEFPINLPGDALLRIDVVDWDGLGDDLIGSTEIDIEDRYFSEDWRNLPMVPVETRTLRLPSKKTSCGLLTMWVDIVPPNQAKHEPLCDISPPPLQDLELRVVVWDVADCPCYDAEGQSDLYVKANCNLALKDHTQSTDVHYRSKTKKGSFNWRMAWPLQLSLASKSFPRLRLQVWDKDLFAPDDSIGETTLRLDNLCKRVLALNNRAYFVNSGDSGERDFYIVDLKNPKLAKEAAEGTPKVKVRIELCPKAYTDSHPAGLGRADPNQHPFLPPPVGRVNWNLLNPVGMCIEICGPDYFKKSCIAFFVAALITGIVYMIPQILAQLAVSD